MPEDQLLFKTREFLCVCFFFFPLKSAQTLMILKCTFGSRQKVFSKCFVLNISCWYLQAFSILISVLCQQRFLLVHYLAQESIKFSKNVGSMYSGLGTVPTGALMMIPHSPSLRSQQSQRETNK